MNFDREEIGSLINIIDKETSVLIEDNNENFLFGSVQHILNERLSYINSKMQDNKQLEDILLEQLKEIARLDKHVKETKEPLNPSYFNTLESKVRLKNNYFSRFSQKISLDTISSLVKMHSDEWLELAKKYKIDTYNHESALKDIEKKINNLKVLDSYMSEMVRLSTMTSQLNTYFKQYSNSSLVEDFLSEINRIASHPSSILQSQTKGLESILQDIDFKGIVDDVIKLHKDIYQDIKKANNSLYLSLGDEFVNVYTTNTSDTSHFLAKKFIDENSIFYHDIGAQGKKNSGIIVFSDNSLVEKTRKGEYRLIDNLKESEECIKDFMESTIDYKLRKYSNISKKMCELFRSLGPHSFSNSHITANTFIGNVAILKAGEFKFPDLKNLDFETLDDKMRACIRTQNIHQYAHSISSSKYRHLYDEKSYTLLGQLYDLNITPSYLQDNIGKKMAAFTTSKAFNEAIESVRNLIDGFTPEAMLIKAENNQTKIAYHRDNILILEIENYTQSKALGSSSWCIVRDNHYFESYTRDKAHQYFIYDFNKASSNNESMIGFTLFKNGEFNTAHSKNDNFYSKNDFLENIIQAVVLNDPASFPDKVEELKNNQKYKGLTL